MDNIYLIKEINHIKKIRNAVILAHNYQNPEIFSVADYVGDSLELSKKSTLLNCDEIVFCGVSFMAETAKILNPDKIVLLPEKDAGCSLADTIKPEEVRKMRKMYPDAAIVAYINTSADVKAECDICCTSSNAVNVVNSLPNKRIIFLPDENLGKYVQGKTHKKLILWQGHCDIHHLLKADSLKELKQNNPSIKIIAHPECNTEVLKYADYISSTSKMRSYVASDDAEEFMIVTECGMINKLAEEFPEKKFYSYCRICPFMKMTTLKSVYTSLLENKYEINLKQNIIRRAREPILKMLKIV